MTFQTLISRMSVVSRFLGQDTCSEIDTVFSLPRRLTHSATKKKDSMEEKRVWKGIIIVEGGGVRR